MPNSLEKKGVNYSRIIQEWLEPQSKVKITWKIYRALEGKLPPAVDSCDCYFVSGSRASLLDKDPWILKLTDFLLICAKAQIPVIGLCFGHQAVAKALGGQVVRAEEGWQIGVKSWKVIRDEGWIREAGKKLTLISLHEDQVSKLPPRSVRIATSEACPNGLFRLANHAVGIQGHPEFTPEIFTELVKSRADVFSKKERDAAIASLETPVDSHKLAKWCMNFVETRA